MKISHWTYILALGLWVMPSNSKAENGGQQLGCLNERQVGSASAENVPSQKAQVTYDLVKLPYATNALEPVIGQQTIELHHGKHLQGYVNNLNKLVVGTSFEGKSLEEIVASAPDGPIFNNAGQVLNHNAYFLQFAPNPNQKLPSGKLLEAIDRDFGSFTAFQKLFNEASVSLFGSGWVWLAADSEGILHITKEANGGNPVRHGLKPILGFDVWEHAYYLDYQNRRKEHIEKLWQIIDWAVVGQRL